MDLFGGYWGAVWPMGDCGVGRVPLDWVPVNPLISAELSSP